MSGQLHEALEPISWLAGRWVTKDGRGHFPNIANFQYHEEVEFTCVGQPMLNYTSTSKHPEKGTPMHQERGFLRIKPGTNDLAFLVSHNFGLNSHEEGHCDPEKKEIKLKTVNIARMSFAKPPVVKNVVREIRLVSPNKLEVVLYMETDSTPLSEHLKAVYDKIE
ncbi:peroxynitrite isomerase THAP4-like [Bicyclus anynana]|uniref:Peroxynitrite isomerase THAP4-like n=1 Tax=Bicyclus anynana TaxID=110368 RepID=A0A6J1NJL0_BICAN|nr:peroxynitrite isomerase THAP4-like [Bicyclus anynana]